MRNAACRSQEHGSPCETKAEIAVLTKAAYILARLYGRNDFQYDLSVTAEVAKGALWDAIDANAGRYGQAEGETVTTKLFP